MISISMGEQSGPVLDTDRFRKHDVCGQCAHFIGMGDWDLCCKKQERRLTYAREEACPSFEQTYVCKNVTNMVGWFICSICGHSCSESQVVDLLCPNCGNAVTGALFGGSLGWME